MQSGAPSSAASRLWPALPDTPSSPSGSGAMLLLREDDGEAAIPRHSSDALSMCRSSWLCLQQSLFLEESAARLT